MTSVCENCGKTFAKSSNLKKHFLKFHQKQGEHFSEKSAKKQFNYTCDICEKNFTHKKHYNHHLRKIHPALEGAEARENFQCPLCPYKGTSKDNCLRHYEQTHGIPITRETLDFQDFHAFNQWRDQTEKTTNSKFVLGATSVLNKSKLCKTIYFLCHRSGRYISKGKGERRLKGEGSNKIGGYCPAGLSVKFDINGKLSVKFISTHVGHTFELKRLQLSITEKKILAEKIARNMSFDAILDEVRNPGPNSELRRINLVTRKDLHNIKQKLDQILRSEAPVYKNVVAQGDDFESLSASEETLALQKEGLSAQLSQILNEVTCDKDVRVVRKILASIPFALATAKTVNDAYWTSERQNNDFNHPQEDLAQNPKVVTQKIVNNGRDWTLLILRPH